MQLLLNFVIFTYLKITKKSARSLHKFGAAPHFESAIDESLKSFEEHKRNHTQRVQDIHDKSTYFLGRLRMLQESFKNKDAILQDNTLELQNAFDNLSSENPLTEEEVREKFSEKLKVIKSRAFQVNETDKTLMSSCDLLADSSNVDTFQDRTLDVNLLSRGDIKYLDDNGNLNLNQMFDTFRGVGIDYEQKLSNGKKI